jgi:hypothetical protein
MVAPEVPTGVAVGQAIFGDQTDGSLLEAAGVEAVGQSQVGNVTGEATATAEAAMAGESDNQIDGAVGPCITEVMEGTGTHGVATGAVATVRTRARRPVATVSLNARLGEVLDTSDALGDIGYILTWITHPSLS